MATNREVFDVIASTWYGVRHWPLLPRELVELAARWQHGRIANLGCGVGSDFLPFTGDFHMVGLDFSRGMLRQALRHMARHATHSPLVQGDLACLPFADASFDHAIGIACYHHIQGESARRKAFFELRRILKPGGEAFVSVWNHLQPRFRSLEQDQFVQWRDGDTTLKRYYHLFTGEELRAELQRAGFEIVRIGHSRMRHDATKEDQRNICALLRNPLEREGSTTFPESAERG